MPSILIPAPELNQDAVAQLRARARRGPDAQAGSPVTLETPLTGRMLGVVGGVLAGDSYGAGQAPLLLGSRVPPGGMWSIYAIADLTEGDWLASVILRIEDHSDPSVPPLRTQEWDLALLHQAAAVGDEGPRQQRLGYLVPPVWVAGGALLGIDGEVVADADDERPRPPALPRRRVAIALLGYAGSAT